MIKILIADDHQLVIDGIKLMLVEQDDIECVAEANNGEEVMKILKNTAIDILVLDIEMPVLNGIETCKRVKKTHPDVKVLALSMLKEASMIKLMLEHGASGYLLKNAGQDEILEAIRRVYNNKEYYSYDVLQTVMRSLTKKEEEKQNKPFIPSLTRREKQVLQLIVDEYTTSEIAEKLFIGFGTVETHRRNLLMKLDVRNTAGLVRMALQYDLLE